MRSIAHHLLAALTLSILASTASAQDAAYEAWSRVFDAIQPGWNNPGGEGSSAEAMLSWDELNVISEYGSGATRPPTAVERAALEKLQQLAPLLRDATSHRSFDAGLDWNEGFSVLLPHLGLMRQSARCLRALAHQAAAEGDSQAAADWTGRIGTLAGQSAQDGTLIGSLVGGAIYSMADQELDALFGSGLLDRETATTLLDGMGWLGERDDPFRVTDAMVLEREIMAMELDRLAGRLDAGDPEAATFFEQLFTGESGAFGDLDGAEVRRQAEVMFDLQTRMIDAASDPDRARGFAEMQAIEAEVEGLEDMALVKSLVPALGNVLEMRLRLEGRLADRLRVLNAIAQGRLDPAVLGNAAILWDRLGTMFETLPGSVQVAGLAMLDAAPTPERLELLASRAVGESASDLRLADGSPRDLEIARLDPVTVWWNGLTATEAEIRELAMLAAALPRADFPISPGILPRPEVESDELARLRGAGRGLLADAWSRLRAIAAEPGPPVDPEATTRPVDVDAEQAAATDEIVATLALVHDLVADPALVHVVMAADLVRSIDRLLRSEEARPLLANAGLRDRITDALNAIPRSVMFDAGAACRADLTVFANRHARGWPAEDRTAFVDRLEKMSPDRAYALIVEDADLRVVRISTDDATTPEPLTPWPDPEGYPTGYRPLRLLASLEGMHGPDHVLSRLVSPPDHDNRVTAAFAAAATKETGVLPRLNDIEWPDRFPLEREAVEALNTVAALDRLMLEIGQPAAAAEAR